MSMTRKLLRRTGLALAVRSGWARHRFMAFRGRLRVLTYHGLIPDDLAERPWVPSHYVTVSQFARQMATLARLGPCPPLSRAVAELREEPAAPARICITFDDGMADNVRLALPILQRYGHHATFFLTTGGIGTTEPLFNDMIRLLRPIWRSDGGLDDCDPFIRRLLTEPRLYKRCSTLKGGNEIRSLWRRHAHRVDPAARAALRLMTWEEARRLVDAGMHLGAHTVHHVILSTETRLRRFREIADSITCIQSFTGSKAVPFAYPNGEPGDYDRLDMRVLRRMNVPFALVQGTGYNTTNTPVFEMARQCIGRHTTHSSFLWQAFMAGPQHMGAAQSAPVAAEKPTPTPRQAMVLA